MENGILKRSLLKLKQIPLMDVGVLTALTHQKPGTIVAYQNYVFLFDSIVPRSTNDVAVFDFRKEKFFNTTTGLNLAARDRSFFCHWKDNIFVFVGDQPRQYQGGGGLFNGSQTYEVFLLYVIETESEITFKVEKLDTYGSALPSELYLAQIYEDNLYFMIGELSRAIDVWQYNLNERHWNQCEVTGQAPKTRLRPGSVLFKDKIYLFGGLEKVPGRGALFGGGNFQKINDLSVLNFENMKWEKIQEDNFLPTESLSGLQAEVVGQNIYISASAHGEFFIYNPASNTLQQSKSISPEAGFIIRSYGNHAMVFRNTQTETPYFEFQMFDLDSQMAEKIESEKPIETKQAFLPQLSHMELLWKEKPFADLTFVVQNEEISAHRVILLKCRYFQNMFQSGMMEANATKINVPDISPTNFKAILEFIYCDKIALTESLALDLIILADMYFLTKLKADCEAYLSTHLTTANLLNVLKAAETSDSEKLNEKVVSFLIANIEKMKQEIDLHMIPPELFIKAISNLKQGKK